MANSPEIDLVLSELHLLDIRNHFEDGYSIGFEDGIYHERERILAVIGLDLLTTEEVKKRLEALVYGGYENVPKP
jgi:hypothetical protein